MKYLDIEENIHRISIRAKDVATHAEVAFWATGPQDKDYHANRCFELLVKLADAFGYDLVKQEQDNEQSAA